MSVLAASAFVACTANGKGRNTFQVPVEYYKLKKKRFEVVLSQIKTPPGNGRGTQYRFSDRAKDRTGFGHLFEHMMFRFKNLDKGVDKITSGTVEL